MPDPIKILQRRLRNSTQTALARELGISVSLLNDTLSGRRPPADAVLRALGLRRVVRYERIPAAELDGAQTPSGRPPRITRLRLTA